MAKPKKTEQAAKVVKRDTRSGRVVRRSLRMVAAADAIGEIESGCEIYGLTGGQFSLIDLIEHVLKFTGPAECVISTWTAAGADVDFALKFLADERLTSLRFIVDFSFPSRQPAYCAALREAFGDDAIRVTKNHAKFVLLRNERWNVAIRTSMNLNENRRLENFEISDCPALSGFLWEFVGECFDQQKSGEGFAKSPGEVANDFVAWTGGSGEDEGGKKVQQSFFGDGPGVVDLRRVGRTRRSWD